MSMAAPGGGNPHPDRCPHCGSVQISESGMAHVPGDAVLRWQYQCAACGEGFLWPPQNVSPE